MVRALILINRTGFFSGLEQYEISHTKIEKSKVNSFQYTGERWPCEVDIEKKSFTYYDDFKAKFEVILPHNLDSETCDLILKCDNLCVYHNNGKFHSKYKNSKDWFARVVFSHPDLINKVQIFFVYDNNCTPLDLNREFFPPEFEGEIGDAIKVPFSREKL